MIDCDEVSDGKASKTYRRPDGSEVKIVAQACAGIGLTYSLDVYALWRESPEHSWKLCSKSCHPDWRKMSCDEYVKYGRPEMLQRASYAEIFGVVHVVASHMERTTPNNRSTT